MLQKKQNLGMFEIMDAVQEEQCLRQTLMELFILAIALWGKENSHLGNIWTGSDNSKFLKMINVRNRDKCSKCWAQNLCLGCCPHENYTNTNNINLASERSCRMAKTIYEKLISVYIKMSDEDKKMMWPEDQLDFVTTQQVFPSVMTWDLYFLIYFQACYVQGKIG